jgi:hypothetical protein
LMNVISQKINGSELRRWTKKMWAEESAPNIRHIHLATPANKKGRSISSWLSDTTFSHPS